MSSVVTAFNQALEAIAKVDIASLVSIITNPGNGRAVLEHVSTTDDSSSSVSILTAVCRNDYSTAAMDKEDVTTVFQLVFYAIYKMGGLELAETLMKRDRPLRCILNNDSYDKEAELPFLYGALYRTNDDDDHADGKKMTKLFLEPSKTEDYSPFVDLLMTSPSYDLVQETLNTMDLVGDAEFLKECLKESPLKKEKENKHTPFSAAVRYCDRESVMLIGSTMMNIGGVKFVQDECFLRRDTLTIVLDNPHFSSRYLKYLLQLASAPDRSNKNFLRYCLCRLAHNKKQVVVNRFRFELEEGSRAAKVFYEFSYELCIARIPTPTAEQLAEFFPSDDDESSAAPDSPPNPSPAKEEMQQKEETNKKTTKSPAPKKTAPKKALPKKANNSTKAKKAAPKKTATKKTPVPKVQKKEKKPTAKPSKTTTKKPIEKKKKN